jgi:hypothetical protein
MATSLGSLHWVRIRNFHPPPLSYLSILVDDISTRDADKLIDTQRSKLLDFFLRHLTGPIDVVIETSSYNPHYRGRDRVLTLAKCLKNKGIQAIVFEKNPSPAKHSYGISLQIKTCQALMKVLGIDEPTFWKRAAVDGLIGGRGNILTKDIREAATERGVRTHRGRVEAC